MTSVVHDVYAMHLASSGKLKLRAKGLLAEGTEDRLFDACVFLHEAARIQRLAVEALPVRPPVTLLTSAVEECWCYIEGRDPPRAAETWGDVLRARQNVTAAEAESILTRVAPMYAATQKAFVRAISSAPTLREIRDAARLAGLVETEVPKARKELAGVLSQFPGATSFWWMQYRLAEMDNDKRGAWDALERARLLAPSNSRFLAMSLLVAAWALPLEAADGHLRSAWPSRDGADAGVCLMLSLAEITLARKVPVAERKARWVRAREAAETGMARVDSEGLRRNLKAVHLLVSELLAGREPTMDILYLAGLGEVAASESANANIADLLATRLRRTEPDRRVAA